MYYSLPVLDGWSDYKPFTFIPSNPRYGLKFEHYYSCLEEDASNEDYYEKNFLVLVDYFHGQERFEIFWGGFKKKQNIDKKRNKRQ